MSEIEHSCDKVIIISRGKVVATDTVANLNSRMRGSEAVVVGVRASATPSEIRVGLEQVPGVSRVALKESNGGVTLFDVESLQGQSVRAELARQVVRSGWDLMEMRAATYSLEDIFLELTASEKKSAGAVTIQ